MSIKAIETEYKGYKFRSRLEARWAVFFDALGIRYLYEDQGYEIGMFKEDKEWYLPDFWLPEHGTYVEVKGGWADKKTLIQTIVKFVDFNSVPWKTDSMELPDHYVNSHDGANRSLGTSIGLLLLGRIPDIPGDGRIPKHDFFYNHKSVYKDQIYLNSFGKSLVTPTGMPREYNGDTIWGFDSDGYPSCLFDASVGGPHISCVAHGQSCAEQYSFVSFGDPPYSPYIGTNFGDTPWAIPDKRLLNAYVKARQARFEHGEKG